MNVIKGCSVKNILQYMAGTSSLRSRRFQKKKNEREAKLGESGEGLKGNVFYAG